MRSLGAARAHVVMARAVVQLIFGVAALACFAQPALAGAEHAWGIKPFENDAAMSWLQQLKTDGSDSIAAAFRSVNEDKATTVGADVCAAAIAAASIVATGRDGAADLLSDDAATWVGTTHYVPDPEVSQQAHTAIVACRRATRSELYMWWMQMDQATAWLDQIKALIQRLGS